MIKTNILGTEYDFELVDLNSMELSKNDGVCYNYDKVIYVREPKFLFTKQDSDEVKTERLREVIIHELIHAYSRESGTCYDDDESLVEWMAFMIPKITASYEEIRAKLEKQDQDNE